MSTCIVYGAYGYTGKLIVEEAVKRGLNPIVAGRNEAKTKSIADRYNLKHRCFDLGSIGDKDLEGIEIFVNAAGPFSKTADLATEACLKKGCHYLDITGEAQVFEDIYKKSDRAKERGVILTPGIGFDVVPTDCIAARLHNLLPDATELELSFATKGKPSSGTLRTAKEAPFGRTLVRRNGNLEDRPLLSILKDSIPFLDGEKCGVAIPWGDLVTAHISTGISNITVYFGLPKSLLKKLKVLAIGNRVVQMIPGLPGLIDLIISKNQKQSSTEDRRFHDCQLWGRATNGKKSLEIRVKTPDGYILTAQTAVEAMIRLAKGDETAKSGYATPSQLFGWQFLKSLDGIVWQEQ